MSEEEVRHVAESLDAIEAIPDRSERVRAMSQVMAAQIERNKAWSEERRQLVHELRMSGLSFRAIATEVGASLSTVQAILSGYSGSGTHRPKKKAGPALSAEQPGAPE